MNELDFSSVQTDFFIIFWGLCIFKLWKQNSLGLLVALPYEQSLISKGVLWPVHVPVL